MWFGIVDSRQSTADSEEKKTSADSSGAKAQVTAGSMSDLKVRPPKEETQDPLAKPASGEATPRADWKSALQRLKYLLRGSIRFMGLAR